MSEAHFREIDKVLLYAAEAKRSAERVEQQLARDGADAHLVEALQRTQEELGEVHRHLMQGTDWAVPKQQLSM